jgi:hypothetical protein
VVVRRPDRSTSAGVQIDRGADRGARRAQQKHSVRLGDGTLQALQALGNNASAAQIREYLAEHFGMQVRPNHLGMALQRHRRTGRLQEADGRWSITAPTPQVTERPRWYKHRQSTPVCNHETRLKWRGVRKREPLEPAQNAPRRHGPRESFPRRPAMPASCPAAHRRPAKSERCRLGR